MIVMCHRYATFIGEKKEGYILCLTLFYKTRHIQAVEDLVAVGLGLALIWFLDQRHQMANQLDL